MGNPVVIPGIQRAQIGRIHAQIGRIHAQIGRIHADVDPHPAGTLPPGSPSVSYTTDVQTLKIASSRSSTCTKKTKN
eukprot:2605534-Pyramimonas_sp.AAC.1